MPEFSSHPAATSGPPTVYKESISVLSMKNADKNRREDMEKATLKEVAANETRMSSHKSQIGGTPKKNRGPERRSTPSKGISPDKSAKTAQVKVYTMKNIIIN